MSPLILRKNQINIYMKKINTFKNTFEAKISIEQDYGDLNLNEGKFGSFIRKHIGPMALGTALSMPLAASSAEKPISKPSELTQNKYISKDIAIIAKTLYGEARGEGDEGMRYVATVIYNRGKGNKNNYAEECLKPKQFSCWNDGPVVVDSKSESYKIATDIASEMMTDKFKPLNDKFTKISPPKFYCNTKLFNSDRIYKEPNLEYIKNVKESGVYEQKGRHVFYNPVPVKKPVKLKSKKVKK